MLTLKGNSTAVKHSCPCLPQFCRAWFWGNSFYLYSPFSRGRGFTGANASLLYGRRQGTPWMSRQLIAGPLLMAEAATQGANCTSGAILGFSILLKDTSTCNSFPFFGINSDYKLLRYSWQLSPLFCFVFFPWLTLIFFPLSLMPIFSSFLVPFFSYV